MTPSAEAGAARVLVVGKDPLITRTLTKLLELDENISVVAEAPSIGTAPIAQARPDIVILDEESQSIETPHAKSYVEEVAPETQVQVLNELRDLTVSELLQTVKAMAPPQQPNRRHLHAVSSGPLPPREAFATLSEREVEVVRLVSQGLSNKQISARLALSDKTVKNHVSHILAKMGLTARTQVAVYAIRAGFV